MKTPRAQSPTSVRIPIDLLIYLKHRAIDNHRSLNSEILVRLDASKKLEEGQDAEKH